jgi:hypothetical protein
LIDGGGWEGNVSWRKPILFGVSTGMTLCSLGWLVDHIRRNAIDQLFEWVVSISLVIEVGLITLQQWRGVASHFNRSSTFDSQVDLAMLVLICIAFIGILYFFVRCFGKMDIGADYAIATRLGMLLLVVSCVIGFAISSYGYQRVSASLPPETIGKGGVTKFPHGVAIHALQILPAIVWLMRRFKIKTEQTKFVVCCLSMSFGFQIAFACYQTGSGLSRFDVQTLVGWILATFAVVAAVVPFGRLRARTARTESIRK